MLNAIIKLQLYCLALIVKSQNNNKHSTNIYVDLFKSRKINNDEFNERRNNWEISLSMWPIYSDNDMANPKTLTIESL